MSKFRLAKLALWMLLAGAVAPAIAQDLPSISTDFLNRETLLAGDSIRFCVYGGSAIGEFDRQVAQLLGDALFLRVEIFEVVPPIDIEGLDTIPLSLDDLFILLTNKCDGFLGVELASEVYPEWVTLTRPYLTVPYVAVVRDGSYESLGDLPPKSKVATQTLTTGDLMFNAYRQTQSDSERLRRLPYPTSVLQFERLRDLTVEAVIVWEPWMVQSDIDTAGLSIVPNGAIPLPSREMGIVLRSRNSFIRSALDQAIEQLEREGTLQRTYDALYPAQN